MIGSRLGGSSPRLRPWRVQAGLSDQGIDWIVWALLIAVGLALTAGLPGPLAVTACLLGALAAVASPAGATAAVLSAVPFVFHPVAVSHARFSLLELATLAGGCGLAVRWMASMLVPSDRASAWGLFRPWATSAIAVALVLVATLSLFTVADRHHLSESVRAFRVVIVEPVGALLLTRWSLRHGARKLLLVALIGTATMVGLGAIGQVWTGSGDIVGNGARRARGPYPHPNNLALYLERVGVVAVALALVSSRSRSIVLVAAGVILAGTAATLSRGAVLGVALGVAVTIALVRPRHGWRWYAAGVAVTLAAFAAIAQGRLVATGSAGTASTRELVWRASLRMGRDHPVFGVGLDQFLAQYGRRYIAPAGWPERYTSHPHNLILDVWLSLGLPGLAVFAALGGGVLVAMLRLRRAARVSNAAAVGAGAALVAGFAHGLVDNAFFLPDLAALTWTFVAFLEQGATTGPVAEPGPTVEE